MSTTQPRFPRIRKKVLLLAIQSKAGLIKHIKSRHSYLFCLVVIPLLFWIGFHCPSFLEIIDIEKEGTKDLLAGILSTAVGVLAVSFAISAILLSILQLANRKISILELVFTNSYFAPVFYFGIINIAILSYLSLFSSHKTLFGSSFALTRVVVLESYLLVVFLLLIILVFTRVFKYLDFAYLTVDYVKDTLGLVYLEKNTSIPERLSQKISQRGREIDQEINEALQKEDEVLISILLNCLTDAFMVNPSSKLIAGSPLFLEKWLIYSHSKKLYAIQHLFLVFWRERMVRQSQQEVATAGTSFLGFAAHVYDSDRLEHSSSSIGDLFSIRLKEMAQYQMLIPDFKEPKQMQLSLKSVDFYLSDFNALIKSMVIANDNHSLRYALNELRQLLSLYRGAKDNDFVVDNDEIANSDFDAMFTEDPPIAQLKLKIQAIPFGIYSWLFYRKLYLNDKTTLGSETLSTLAGSFLEESPATPFDIITFYFTHRDQNYHWNDWLWNLEERLSGVVYSLPSPEDMLSVGLLCLLLEKRSYDLAIPNRLLAIPELQSVLDRIRTSLSILRSQPSLCCEQFRFADQKEFNQNCDRVTAWLDQINVDREQLQNELLAQENLDPQKVSLFIENMQRQWKDNDNMGKIFDHFQAIVINPQQELKRIGMNINAENLKFAFVHSKSSAPFVGLDFGKEIARNKEQLFGRFLWEKHLPVSTEPNLVTGLLNSIADLKKHQKDATIIFSTYRSLVREEINLSNSGNYTPQFKESSPSFPFRYMGVFDNNIPMVRVFSDFYKDHIIVADLPRALHLLEREEAPWFEKRLQVEVIQIDRAKAEEIYQRKGFAPDAPDKEPQINKIMTGVIIDIDEICDFTFADKGGVRVFRLP